MFDDFPFKVIDDFLPTPYWKKIHDFLCSPDFPWYYQENIVNIHEPSKLGCYGFNYHILRSDEQILTHNYQHSIQEMILPFGFLVQDAIGVESQISRIRCDMTLYNPNVHMHENHVDLVAQKHVAAVYYVNNSDGPTVIYKKKVELNGDPKWDNSELEVMLEVEPLANRLVLFDGSFVHTGHSPSKTNSRVIINSDYLI